MKTTRDPLVFYNEDTDEFIMNTGAHECLVLDGEKAVYWDSNPNEFVMQDFGDLVECDEEGFPHAE